MRPFASNTFIVLFIAAVFIISFMGETTAADSGATYGELIDNFVLIRYTFALKYTYY